MQAKTNNSLVELLITLIIPSLILMKWSDEANLGAVRALLLALAFPLAWGAYDLVRRRKLNLFAALGLVSILLTGGIGLLELDKHWLAVKEAAIPAVLGIGVIISGYTRYPLVRSLLYSPKLINVGLVQQNLEMRGNVQAFEARLQAANWQIGGTFFFSATMNYFLATWIVVSPAGSAAFNEELGRLTLMSYPMIAIPSMLMMVAVFYGLSRAIKNLAGLKLMEILHQAGE
jgi:intracellular septation protein A